MIRPYIGTTRQLVVRGIAAVLFGLATLVWPGITLLTLILLWGSFALVDGGTSLSAAIRDRQLRHRGWVALSGVSGIIAGLVTFVWPSITALALLFVIAAWAFAGGISLIAMAISERKRLHGEWALALMGALSVLLGAVLVISPAEGALGITWAIGWHAILSGTLSLSLAWDSRRERRPRSTTSPRAPRPEPVAT